ncbi:putative O-linked N-acetylglucosamine transferase, SPINDLY family [Burkholderiales bacterium JOSHI_001]|nr:putative O-linked N-acetylglucosamine transferase, SPINDLY family [Burkholderiales bacterium JOSHI_001]
MTATSTAELNAAAQADGWGALLQQAATGTQPLQWLIDNAQRLAAQGQAAQAAQLYEAWVGHTASPHLHVACFNWGTLLASLGRGADATAAYRRALALLPGFAQARVNLGHELERQGENEQALAEWRTVAEASLKAPNPDRELTAHAMNNQARLLEQLKRFDEAEAWMRRSLEFDPLQPSVIQHYVHIRQKQCEWPVYSPVGQVTANQLLCHTSALAMLSASDDPALQLLAARQFVAERVPKPGPALFDANRVPGDKLRIGYLSGDLHMHAVGLLTVELLELHDKSRFEVFGYCWGRNDGTSIRARILAALDHHVPIAGMDDLSAARRIAADGIDVLIDLQGLTNGARPAILVNRPAPVQVSYLGLPATSALPGVDWILADDFVVPPELRPCLSEKPIYLPNCYQSSDRQRDMAPRPQRNTYGLPEDAFVYCSFNNNFKFTPEVFGAWMRMLKAVPNSVLWLLADNRWAEANMRAFAKENGVDAARLIFAPRVSPAEYVARFQLADLVLDTFPYNAGTTANDVLWAGTPILTLSGRSYISRMCGSLLTAVGLPELITTSLAEYEQRAIQIGRQPARSASYKRYLAEEGRRSALFDMPRFVRDYETALDRIARDPAARRGDSFRLNPTGPHG